MLDTAKTKSCQDLETIRHQLRKESSLNNNIYKTDNDSDDDFTSLLQEFNGNDSADESHQEHQPSRAYASFDNSSSILDSGCSFQWTSNKVETLQNSFMKIADGKTYEARGLWTITLTIKYGQLKYGMGFSFHNLVHTISGWHSVLMRWLSSVLTNAL